MVTFPISAVNALAALCTLVTASETTLSMLFTMHCSARNSPKCNDVVFASRCEWSLLSFVHLELRPRTPNPFCTRHASRGNPAACKAYGKSVNSSRNM